MRYCRRLGVSAFLVTLLSLTAFASSASAQQQSRDVRAANASADVLMQLMTFAETFGLPARLQEALVDASMRARNSAESTTGSAEGKEALGSAGSEGPAGVVGGDRTELESEALEALEERDSGDAEETGDPERSAKRGAEGEAESDAAATGMERLATGGRDGSAAAEEGTVGMDGALGGESKSRSSSEAGADLGVRGAHRSVREVIDLYRDQIADCYRQRLAQRPGLAGKVTLEFVVGAEGDVVTSRVRESTLEDRETETCMVETVRRIDFPRPASGQKTTWNVPFQLGVE